MTDRWYETAGPEASVVVSTRIRLARNLKDRAFPNRLSHERQKETNEEIKQAFFDAKGGLPQDFSDLDPSLLSPVEQELLVEKRLISRDLLTAGHPVLALIRRDESVSLMLGEEDHIRIQAMAAGFDLDQTYAEAVQLAMQIEEILPIAFTDEWGFLTACPTNTGTGMRASAMLHLPALEELNQMKSLATQLAQLGLTVRGARGEGSDPTGCLYQISNQITLGLSEEDLIQDLKKAVQRTMSLEHSARTQLLEIRQVELEDRVFRSLGILQSARILGQDEAERLLSDLRWGVELGMIPSLNLADIALLHFRSGRALIQKMAGRSLSPKERDRRRALELRQLLDSKTKT